MTTLLLGLGLPFLNVGECKAIQVGREIAVEIFIGCGLAAVAQPLPEYQREVGGTLSLVGFLLCHGCKYMELARTWYVNRSSHSLQWYVQGTYIFVPSTNNDTP